MHYRRHHDPAEFAEHVMPFMALAEAQNNLAISIASGLARRDQVDGSIVMASASQGDEVACAGVMTPPYNLVLTSGPDTAVVRIADELYQAGVTVPGLLAPSGAADHFVARWSRLTGQAAKLEKTMRTHQLESVTPVSGVSGSARAAVLGDADTVVDWYGAFHAETHSIASGREPIVRGIERGDTLLWVDPDPVAMACVSGSTPSGKRVSGVYTPPDLRRRGYATALVAELSQLILDSSARFCFLFTDLANPISNSIYAKIGYVPVCDFAEYRFGTCVQGTDLAAG